MGLIDLEVAFFIGTGDDELVPKLIVGTTTSLLLWDSWNDSFPLLLSLKSVPLSVLALPIGDSAFDEVLDFKGLPRL